MAEAKTANPSAPTDGGVEETHYTDQGSGRAYQFTERQVDIKEWRRNKAEGEEFVLPSGLMVRLRKVSLLDLASTQGEIIQTLIPTMEKLQSGEPLKASEYAEYAEIMRVIAKNAIVYPKISMEMGVDANSDELSIEELDVSDLIPIFEWTNEVGRLKKFRS